VQLQDDLDSLVYWADTWQLRYNADKCKVLQLEKNNEQQDYSMRRHGGNERVMIEKSSVEKDLVVYVDKELKFSKYVFSQQTSWTITNQMLLRVPRCRSGEAVVCCCRAPEYSVWKRCVVTEI
jgi:hypothetical protein